jgi:hypothetical protein
MVITATKTHANFFKKIPPQGRIFRIRSKTAIKIGSDNTIIIIFAANSIFEAVAEDPASLQIWAPNSAI